MSQTTAPLREMVPGRLGLAAEPFSPSDVKSRVNTTLESFFGRLVLRDSASGEEHIKHPDAAFTADGRVVDGVVMSTHAIESSRDVLDPHYPAQDTVNVMRKGYIWVAIEEDVAVGDPVFVRHTAGAGGTKLGAFRNDADTASAQDISAIAKWEKGGLAADGIALLEINLI